MKSSDLSPEDRQICADLLQRIAEDPDRIADDERLKGLIAKIYRTQRKASRQSEEETRRTADRTLSEKTAMVRRDRENAPVATHSSGDEANSDTVGTLYRTTPCYVCKRPFAEVHFFYHRLCPTCARFNYEKRNQRADLTGRIALLTGGRIKIGYQTALRLLRDGAHAIVTTRFPDDAARRFHAEPDAAEWANRLSLRGLDLRNLPAVEAFAAELLATEPHLDILINNAAQAVKRPLDFYRHLLDEERTPSVLLEAQAQSRRDDLALPSLTPESAAPYFPVGQRDVYGQQIDLRPVNSWVQTLHEVDSLEMVEAQFVNAAAPFILCSRLKPAFLRSPHPRRFIVNVSSLEGQFGRESKGIHHPHTNMSKAALNMLTRTSAADYARDGIYMNSVDTGWISDEKPLPMQERLREKADFHTPLDAIDSAARLYDPIATGLAGEAEPLFGHYLKDFAPYPW